MQGFILHVRKARNEDTVVTVLTSEKVETLYRFYGARHPVVTTGYKVDFEAERDDFRFLPRMRHVIHLGYPWLKEAERLAVWQHFCSLLYEHLKEVEIPGSFYFDLLERYAAFWHLQNPKRGAVEAYLELLAHEGRLHPPLECFLCGGSLEEKTALARAFLPAHPRCVVAKALDTVAVKELFETQKSIHLEDETVETLWLTLLEGM